MFIRAATRSMAFSISELGIKILNVLSCKVIFFSIGKISTFCKFNKKHQKKHVKQHKLSTPPLKYAFSLVIWWP